MTEICSKWHALDGISQEFMGEVSQINPVVGIDDEGLVLIDSGPPGSIAQMESALGSIGFGIEDIRWIFITHYHFDHVGNLVELMKRNSKANCYMGKEDIPYFLWHKKPEEKPLDLDEVRNYFPNVTDEIIAEMSSDDEDIEPPEIAFDIIPITGGVTEFPQAGGFKVISTPGHTPGHVSVYLEGCRTLVAGDLMMYWKNSFSGPIHTFSSDPSTAEESVREISKLGIETMVGYHGKPLFKTAGETINKYISGEV